MKKLLILVLLSLFLSGCNQKCTTYGPIVDYSILRDKEQITLELKDGSKYTMHFYSDSTVHTGTMVKKCNVYTDEGALSNTYYTIVEPEGE